MDSTTWNVATDGVSFTRFAHDMRNEIAEMHQPALRVARSAQQG